MAVVTRQKIVLWVVAVEEQVARRLVAPALLPVDYKIVLTDYAPWYWDYNPYDAGGRNEAVPGDAPVVEVLPVAV